MHKSGIGGGEARPNGTMKPTLSISANATPGLGGQGLNFQHMLETYADDFDVTVYGAGLRPADRGETIPPSASATMIGRIPVIRRLHDWQAYFADTDFDRAVAARLKKCAVFQGAVGQSRDSISSSTPRWSAPM